MNRQTIEQAADNYAAKAKPSFTNGDFDKYAIAEAFECGADWRINSVWHDASEKPNKNQLILFEHRQEYGKGYSVTFGDNYEIIKSVLIRWAYIDDILPERKEGDK